MLSTPKKKTKASPPPGWWDQALKPTGDGGTYREQRVVVQQYQPDVGGARERELVDHADLVVSQQDGRDVLQAGERELLERAERRVLDGQLAEPAQAAERETLHAAYAVGVQRQLAQVPEPGERVAGQVRQVVFGHRQVFNGLGQFAQRHVRQVSGVTQDLLTHGPPKCTLL